MPELNRGKLIRGYFTVNPNKPDRLFGARWLNPFPCGIFVNAQGVTKGATFFMFYEDELNDQADGKFKESLDIDMQMADTIPGDEILGDMIKRIPLSPAKLAKLDPQQQAIIAEKYPTGFLPNKAMVTRDMIKLTPQWLGRTLQKAIHDRPIIWQPTVVDGIEVPNVWKCSLEVT